MGLRAFCAGILLAHKRPISNLSCAVWKKVVYCLSEAVWAMALAISLTRVVNFISRAFALATTVLSIEDHAEDKSKISSNFF